MVFRELLQNALFTLDIRMTRERFGVVAKKENRYMTPAQSRAARELLGLTQEQLADVADLSFSTIQDFELERPVHSCLVATIRVALEALGVEFMCGDRVRLRKDVRV